MIVTDSPFGIVGTNSIRERLVLDSFTIYMKNFTHAQKAYRYLTGKRISCRVERSFGRGQGCGFVLRVTGGADRNEVCALLSDIGVSCDIS